MLDGCAPDTDEARGLLIELETQTSLPRALRARLLGVPAHSLRRWEDNTRKPDRAACRLIALTCAAVVGLDAFQIRGIMMEQANAVARDSSRAASERLKALRSIPHLGIVQAELSRRILGLTQDADSSERRAA